MSQQTVPTAATALCAVALGAVMLLTGCGGSPLPGAGAERAEPRAAQRGGAFQASVQAPAPAEAQAEPSVQAVAPIPLGNTGYALILFNDRVVHQDLDQLDARHGKGYAPLQAFVYASGRPRKNSPVAGVKPVCSPTQCEYLPPREGGRAERYVIAIDDPAVAHLSARDDMVVITARQLALDQPVTLNVTLSIPGERTVVKRIVYGAALS